MSLLSPLALAFSLLAVPIVLMYVLRVRRRETVVSSTLLWRRALDDLPAVASGRRFQPNMLLILQLLALAALVLAFAAPAYSHETPFTGDVIVIVDQSYAMQGSDVAPTRFAEALKRAHHVVDTLASHHLMSLIGMENTPHLVLADSANRELLAQEIDRLPVGFSQPDFPAALRLAESLARPGPGTQIIVFTSHDSGITRLPFSLPIPVRIERIGGQLHDVGITSFHAAHSGDYARAVLHVRNGGPDVSSTDVHLVVDGQLVDVRPLRLAPGQETTQVWSHLPSTVRRLQVNLTRRDDVTADKTAWSVLAGHVRHVLLVSRGGYFLATALALDASVQLDVIPPVAYSPSLVGGEDLVIFDGFLPPVLPARSTLLVAPSAGMVGGLRFGVERTVGVLNPAPSLFGPISALLAYADLSDVHVARARDLSLPSWLQPVILSSSRTLFAAGEDGTRRLAVLPFDLQESDWPLRVSFPVVIQNLLHYLVPGLGLDRVELSIGRHIRLFPVPGAAELQVTLPDGRTDRLAAPAGVFTDTATPGIYVVHSVGSHLPATDMFAVNAFQTPVSPAAGPAVQEIGQRNRSGAKSETSPVRISWVFGFIALAVLSLEWWLAVRR